MFDPNEPEHFEKLVSLVQKRNPHKTEDQVVDDLNQLSDNQLAELNDKLMMKEITEGLENSIEQQQMVKTWTPDEVDGDVAQFAASKKLLTEAFAPNVPFYKRVFNAFVGITLGTTAVENVKSALTERGIQGPGDPLAQLGVPLPEENLNINEAEQVRRIKVPVSEQHEKPAIKGPQATHETPAAHQESAPAPKKLNKLGQKLVQAHKENKLEGLIQGANAPKASTQAPVEKKPVKVGKLGRALIDHLKKDPAPLANFQNSQAAAPKLREMTPVKSVTPTSDASNMAKTKLK